jgi:hypothetical protein
MSDNYTQYAMELCMFTPKQSNKDAWTDAMYNFYIACKQGIIHARQGFPIQEHYYSRTCATLTTQEQETVMSQVLYEEDLPQTGPMD